MANFNSKKVNKSLTKNSAGGVAYKVSSKAELVTLMLTSFLSGDKAYESNRDTLARFTSLAEKMLQEDKIFLAKASLYARDKYKMRSVSHLASSLLLQDVIAGNWSNEEKAQLKSYLSQVIMRPDDITETISCYSNLPGAYKNSKGRVQLPAVAKKGFSAAMANYDEYRMAKYKNSEKEISLVDAVRMIRPKATDKNKSALKKLIEGTLKSTSTWEAKQSQAGKAGNAEDVAKAKREAWSEFLNKGNKIEYFALLRNLRNILEQCNTEDIDKACALLEDERLISKSKILPFRYISACVAVQDSKASTVKRNKVLRALNRAVNASLGNIPKLPGSTAILLDISGSMSSPLSEHSDVSIKQIANMFAAALYKANDSKVILFNNDARELNADPCNSVFSIANSIPCGGGTDMSCAFKALGSESFDNIIILSDMQTWFGDSWTRPASHFFNNWKKVSGSRDCKLFSFDLAGHGSSQFPEQNIYLLSGWSENSLEMMVKMGEDKYALINEIESIVL